MEPTPSVDAPDLGTDDPYLDTVSMLQEEIARLEAELRMRDEPAAAAESPAVASDDDAARRIGELTAQLAERDEVIGLLWDQLSALEEAQAARSSEWNELHRWVEELESRIGDGDRLGGDPDGGRREAEALRAQLDEERRGWEAQRRRFEDEFTALRVRIDETARADGDPALAALAEENRRLRDEGRRLADPEADPAEAATLRDRVRELQLELGRTRDELRDACLRHEAELAAQRTQQSQATPRFVGADLSPHERVRALRDHLRDLHEREEQERQERKRTTGLARLWQRSGPRR